MGVSGSPNQCMVITSKSISSARRRYGNTANISLQDLVNFIFANDADKLSKPEFE